MKLLRLILFWLCWAIPLSGYAQKTPVFKVVLDAGHGGKDPGKVVNKTIYEKDVVLKIALLVGKKLEAHPDIKVIYTRKTDELIDLYERGAIANKNKADVFVSIHCNAHETQVEGAETYVLGLNANEQNFEVAKVRQAGFIVLHQTYMPSILIETAFLTNNEERKFLTSEKGQEEFAENIATAILTYKKWIQGQSSYIAPDDSVSVHGTGRKQPANRPTEKEAVSYKIQISSSPKRLEAKPFNFKGLSPISTEKDGKVYVYYYGDAKRHKEALTLLSNAKKKGYKDAYIAAFHRGKRITIEKAKQIEK